MNTNSPRFAKILASLLIGLLILFLLYPFYEFMHELKEGYTESHKGKLLVERYLTDDAPKAEINKTLEKLEKYDKYSIASRYSSILFLFFSGLIITIIWRRGIISSIIKSSNLWINEKGEKQIDYGLFWFAIAILLWLISRNLELGCAERIANHDRWIEALTTTISTLNTAAILVGVSYFTFFRVDSTKWWKVLYKPLKFYKKHLNTKRLFGIASLFIFATIVFTIMEGDNNHKESWAHIPDFVLSFLSLPPLFAFLYVAFSERELNLMWIPIALCVIIILISQYLIFIGHPTGVERTERAFLGNSYQYLLITLFLTFTFSGAAAQAEEQEENFEKAKKQLKERNNKLAQKNEELKEVSSKLAIQNKDLKQMSFKLETKNDELNLLSAEMNHSIKGNLTVLLDSLLTQLKIITNNKGKAIIKTTITRLEAMKMLHTTIHNQTELSINLESHVNKLCSILDKSLNYEGELDNYKDVFTDIDVPKAIARKISQIITEIAINSTRTADRKQLTKKFLIKIEDSDEHLIIDIEDNSGGINMDMFKIEGIKYLIREGAEVGFGLRYVLRTIQDDLEGNIHIASSDKGTKFNIKIPFNELIYKLKNKNYG